MPEKHALLGPSGAKRWLSCTPSARFEEFFPDSESEAAEEGTVAHRLCELLLQRATGLISTHAYDIAFKKEIKPRKNKEGVSYYNAAMQEYCDEFMLYVLEVYQEMKNEDEATILMLEKEYDISMHVPEGFGTSDITIVNNIRIRTVDFKYGQGVEVEVGENDQLRLYATGAVEAMKDVYDFSIVEMTIYQPRINNIGTYTETLSELMDWVENYVKPRAQLAFDGLGIFAAGDHCRFCRGRAECKTLADSYKHIGTKYEYVAGNRLHPRQIADILDIAPTVIKWISSIQDHAALMARRGEKIPGYKIVEGRSNRSVVDHEKAFEILHYDANFKYAEIVKPFSLVSLTDLESVVGKTRLGELIGDLIVKPAGAPTLVHSSDRRPELGSADAATADFDDGFTGEKKPIILAPELAELISTPEDDFDDEL